MVLPVIYSPHALDMLAERGIEPAWVERTVAAPDQTEPDPIHADRTRAYRALPERNGRVLRVVYIHVEDGVRVVTVFLDRNRSRGR